jgi:hypothetical protein
MQYFVWIIMAWWRISSEVTVKGFKKCCISIAMYKTDRSGCEEDEGTECEDGDSDADW